MNVQPAVCVVVRNMPLVCSSWGSRWELSAAGSGFRRPTSSDGRTNLFGLFGLEPGSIIQTREYVLERTHPGDRERVARYVESTRRALANPAPIGDLFWLRINQVRHRRMPDAAKQPRSFGVPAALGGGEPSGALAALIVDDSNDDAELAVSALEEAGYLPVRWRRVEDAVGMQTALAEESWDVVLCDHLMPAFDSFKALAVLGASGFALPLILVSGAVGEETRESPRSAQVRPTSSARIVSTGWQ